MGRTILYILIGISVAGALAVLLLITPISDPVEITPTIPENEAAASETVLANEVAPLDDVPTQAVATQDNGNEPEPSSSEPVMQEPVAIQTGYSIDGTIVSGEYPHEMNVAGVDVYWANDDVQLRIGLVSPGTGFVSIGIDPERQMEGANYIIASMNEGVLTIRDDYGHEPLAHMEDTARGGQNNILASAGNEWPDQTVVEFIIPLDSGDAMDKPLLPGHEYTILVAYHSMLDSFSNRHTRRGSAQMQLDL